MTYISINKDILFKFTVEIVVVGGLVLRLKTAEFTLSPVVAKEPELVV